MVGWDGREKYENEVRESFPCCPLCGSKQIVTNLIPGGRDSLLCDSCKAQWHLIIGLGGLKWAELEQPSTNGEGRNLIGRRFEKRKMAKNSTENGE